MLSIVSPMDRIRSEINLTVYWSIDDSAVYSALNSAVYSAIYLTVNWDIDMAIDSTINTQITAKTKEDL